MVYRRRWAKSNQIWEMDNSSDALDSWLSCFLYKAKATRVAYVTNLRLFCDYIGEPPQRIYEMRLTQIDGDNPLNKREIEKKVLALMAEMARGTPPWGKGVSFNEPKAPATCRQLYKAVASFLENMGDRKYELYIKAKDRPRGDGDGISGVSAEQILEMWRVGGDARLRNRACTTFLKDSGVRIGDLAGLNVGHYREARNRPNFNEAGEMFLIFDPRRTKKCGVFAHIHIGPEAVDDIDRYLKEKRRVAADSEPLIAKWGMNRGQGIDFENPRMTVGALSTVYTRLSEKLGHRGRKVSAHSLRKFHKTALEAANLPDNWIKKLQGKKADTYSRQSDVLPGELLKRYMEAYNKLRIHSSKTMSDVRRDTKIKILESEVRELKEELVATVKMLQDNVIVIPRSDSAAEVIEDDIRLLYLAAGKLPGGWNDKKRWEEEERP